MAAPFTEKQAREAIATLVEEASGSERVYSFNCLDYKTRPDGSPDFGHWPGLFSYTDGGAEIVHGWVIRRTARASELRAGCEDFNQLFDVSGFYGFYHDALVTNSANSDDDFGRIVDAVAERFNQGAGNGLITVNGVAVQHYGLQFNALTVLRAGTRLIHFAGGMIELQYLS